MTVIEIIDQTTGQQGFRELGDDMLIEHPITLEKFDLRELAGGKLKDLIITGAIFEKDGGVSLMFEKKQATPKGNRAIKAIGEIKAFLSRRGTSDTKRGIVSILEKYEVD